MISRFRPSSSWKQHFQLAHGAQVSFNKWIHIENYVKGEVANGPLSFQGRGTSRAASRISLNIPSEILSIFCFNSTNMVKKRIRKTGWHGIFKGTPFKLVPQFHQRAEREHESGEEGAVKWILKDAQRGKRHVRVRPLPKV